MRSPTLLMFGQEGEGAQDPLLRPARGIAKGQQEQQADGAGDGQRVATGRQGLLNLGTQTPAIRAECV